MIFSSKTSKPATDKLTFIEFTATTVDESVRALKTNLRTGLSTSQAELRLKEFGFNQLVSHTNSWWEILIRQFKSPFIYLLIAAAILALFLGEFTDASFILVFIVINAGLGFFQEYRSEQAIKLLRKYTAAHAKVIRDGKEILLSTSHLVPGDIVLLQPGDVVPADVQLVEAHNLVIDESILSGESKPVSKTTKPLSKATSQLFAAQNIGFSGTHVVTGSGLGVVIGTGKNAYMGTIAHLTTETTRVSTFEKGMSKFSTFVLRLVIITLIIVFIANLVIKGEQIELLELIIFSIALATAVIPEALPLVTTFSLSRGAMRLAHNKVVVKRLSAIEDLGSVEVLCTDKTGTITQNKLTVTQMYGDDHKRLLTLAALAVPPKQAGQKTLDPFDTAILDGLRTIAKTKLPYFTFLEEIPFDPERRSNSVLVKRSRARQLIVRGAAESLLPKCYRLTATDRKKITLWIDEAGKKGLRTLTIISKPFHKDTYTQRDEQSRFEYVGTIAFIDPLKKSTKQAINHAKELGVQVKILTGDSASVAGAVAEEIGLISSSSHVITGDDFDKLSQQKKEKAVNDYHVFARVNPQQKYQIVRMLEKSHEVGFLGEGINDAPALKSANVALVVQNASDIAKDAADIILLNSSLEVIINGIQEGRQVFANTIKYVKLTLSSNFGNFYAVAIASLIVDYLPMLPIQILLVNLLTDSPLVSVATDSVDSQDIAKPESYNLKDFALFSTTLGLVSTVFDFIFFGSFYRISQAVLQTNWMIGSVLTELVLIFSLRTRKPFYKAGLPSKPILVLSLLAALAVLMLPFTSIGVNLFKLTPPSGGQMIWIMVVVAGYFVSSELVKYLYYKFLPEVK